MTLTRAEEPARSLVMRYRILLFLTLFLLGGCVSTQQVEDLQGQIYSLNVQIQALDKRLSALEKQVAKLSAKSQALNRLDKLAARQADLFTELEKIRADELRLNGQMEQLTYQQSQDREAFREFQAEISKRLAALEEKLASGPQTSPKKEPAKPDEQSLYEKALDAYRQKKFEEAQGLFEEYLKLYPQGKRAPNAYFWIGECLFQRHRYEEAILAYQKVIDQFPKSSKVPAALLKQGFAFLRLGDTEAARIVFKKLVRAYPHSSQARVARKYLRRLSKSR